MNLFIRDNVLRIEGRPLLAAQLPISKRTMAELNNYHPNTRLLDVNVYCKHCGLGLCALTDGRLSKSDICELYVPPCPRCMGVLT